MHNRTFIVITALAALALITFLVLWRNTKISDVGSSSAVMETAAPRATPPAGLSRLNDLPPGRGSVSEEVTQTPEPAVPSHAATEPSMESLTVPVPGAPIKNATEGAVGASPAEATVTSEKTSRPAEPKEISAIASMTPSAAVSEPASRVQLAASMQGLEPGSPIDLPIRLSPGQSRTIYFFTELRGLSGRTVIHRYEWNGRIIRERQLHPSSQSWRAYTAMTITGDMRGSWRVAAVDTKTDKVLAERRFDVEQP
jgi:hypothetical protein